MGSGGRQGAKEPPLWKGREEAARQRARAQREVQREVQQAARTEEQAMGTQRPRHHQVRRLGCEDLRRG